MTAASTTPTSPPKFAPIYTERLELRVFDSSKPSDYEDVLAVYDSDYARRTVGNPGVYTPEDLDARCARFRPRPSSAVEGDNVDENNAAPYPFPFPTHPLHIIYLRDTDTLVGLTSLYHRPLVPSPDLGYAILEAHINRGYATEAARASLAWWTREMRVPDIWVGTFDTNFASQRVARKMGLVDGGQMRLVLGPERGGTKVAKVFVQSHMGMMLDGLVVDVSPLGKKKVTEDD